MSYINVIHCDKCDSTNVLHEEVRAKPQEFHLTMTELIKENSGPKINYAVYHRTRYKLVCKDCGYILEYQV